MDLADIANMTFLDAMLFTFSIVGGAMSVFSGLFAAGLLLDESTDDASVEQLGVAVDFGVAVGFLYGAGILLGIWNNVTGLGPVFS